MTQAAEKISRFRWQVLLLATLAGCAPTGDRVDSEVESVIKSLQPGAGDERSALESVYGLGPVLAHGQTLRHEFELRNPSDKPLRILGAEALTPCCSAVDKLPNEVPPGGHIKVPVTFKPGTQKGRRQVRFVLRTDSATVPDRAYTLIAESLPEFECEVLSESDATLLLGQSGKQRLRVTCRRVGGVGLSAFDSIVAHAPLHANVAGPPTVVEAGYGSTVTTQDVEVSLPAAVVVGHRLDSLVFQWTDGTTREQRIAWRVRSCIEATPPALIVERSRKVVTRLVRLQSADKPFHVVEVAGRCLAEPCVAAGGLAKNHVLRLSVAADLAGVSAETSDISIRTDHPAQPTIPVTVTILARAKGE